MPEKDPLNISGQIVAEKYRIEHLVGEGGFAVVYRAEHTIWKQPVAVKFFSGLSQAPAEYRDELLHQFIQEGALLTELSSQTAGIVQARDVGEYTTGTGQWMPFMVLEWLDGTPLDTILAQDKRQGLPWTEGEVVGFLRRILPILDVAHERGIAHRDIKPANIFVMGSAARSEGTPCKLLDFGVAKMVNEQAKVNAALAKTGVAITSFTPYYGAPEQFTRSYGATGPWTDVYSLALVACEMLTCRVALQGDDIVQVGFASANPAERPTPRSLGVLVSDRLEAVFTKALAVHPEERFRSAGEFLESTLAAVGIAARGGVDVAVPASSRAASSPSLQLAPTVLVSADGNAASPATMRPAPATMRPKLATTRPEPTTTRPELATTRPEPAPTKESTFGTGSLLFVLLVLAGGVVGYSTTGFRGARELREFFSPAVRLVRREAAQHLPKLRDKTRKVVDDAVGALAGAEGQDRPPPECPPGTRLIASPLAHDQDAMAGSGVQGAAGAVCVDERPVSEVEYEECATCERPRLGKLRAKLRAKVKTRGHSEFCMSGKTPIPDSIRCVTWRQADAYCRARAARLPTEDELAPLIPTPTVAPREWTGAAPGAGHGRWGPFRCVRPLGEDARRGHAGPS